MRRFTQTVVIALALLAAPPAAQAANPVVGIADQKPGTFTQKNFKALHVKRSRYVAPWNVALDKTQKARFNAWYKAARKAHIKDVMVAFSATAGSRCPSKPCRLPSTRQF